MLEVEEVEVTEAVTVKEVLVGSKVERGYLDLRSKRSVAQRVLILAESVPSWMFLVPLLGCTSLVVYVADPAVWFSPPSLDNVTIRVEVSMVLAMGCLGVGCRDDTLVLLQGSMGFVLETIDQLVKSMQGAKFIALCTGRRSWLASRLRSYNPPLTWGSFSHSEIGGGDQK